MIETNRLLIKPLAYDELLKHLNSPDELARDLGLTPSGVLMDTDTRAAILDDLLPNLRDENKDALFYTMWLLIEKHRKVIVGGLCFHGEPDATGEVEIGYGTDEAYRNQGYMTEALAGMVQWARIRKRIKIIKAEADNTNISSLRVLEKNDFQIVQRTDNAVIFKIILH